MPKRKYKIFPQKSTGLKTSRELTEAEVKQSFEVFKRFGYKKSQFKVKKVEPSKTMNVEE